MWWEKNIRGMREKVTVKIEVREKKETNNGYNERKDRENNKEGWERELIREKVIVNMDKRREKCEKT